MTLQEITDFIGRSDTVVTINRTTNTPPGVAKQWITSCVVTTQAFRSTPFDSITDLNAAVVECVEKANAWRVLVAQADALVSAEG